MNKEVVEGKENQGRDDVKNSVHVSVINPL